MQRWTTKPLREIGKWRRGENGTSSCLTVCTCEATKGTGMSRCSMFENSGWHWVNTWWEALKNIKQEKRNHCTAKTTNKNYDYYSG